VATRTYRPNIYGVKRDEDNYIEYYLTGGTCKMHERCMKCMKNVSRKTLRGKDQLEALGAEVDDIKTNFK